MSAILFANHSKTAPIRRGTDQHPLICHSAAMYWAFRVLTRSKHRSADRVESIAAALCLGCHHAGAGLAMHGSISHEWYGANMCRGAVPVEDLWALKAFVNVGDVLIIGPPQRPMHSMVVVATDGPDGQVLIRGFNNTGTLNKGPRDQYDNASRRVAKAELWHTLADVTHFGQGYAGGGKMYRIEFSTYVYNNAQALMRKFKRTAGVMHYTLP